MSFIQNQLPASFSALSNTSPPAFANASPPPQAQQAMAHGLLGNRHNRVDSAMQMNVGAFRFQMGSPHDENQARPDSLLTKVTNALLSIRPDSRHLFLEALFISPLFSSLFESTSSITACTTEHDQFIEQSKSLISSSLPMPTPSIPPPATPERPREIQNSRVISAEIINEYSQYSGFQQKIQAVLSIKAKSTEDITTLKSKIAITSVLDISGSMAGPRIELLKGTSHFLIDEMTSDDFLGLISYSSQSHEILPLCKMSSASKKFAHSVINRLEANGGTALYDGLLMGLKQILTSDLPDSSSISSGVLLCTDGAANEGPATADAILPKLHAEKMRLNQAAINLSSNVHCFGIGLGHDASLLQTLSESMSGSYYFLAQHTDIAPGYGDLLASLKSTVAKDISILIKPVSGITINKVLSGGSITNTPEGCTTIQFSNLFDGETRELLLQFNAPGSQAAVDWQGDLGEVKISYTDLVTGARVEQTLPIQIKCGSQGEPPEAPDLPHPLVVATAARYDTREIIERARVEGEAGRLAEAETMLRSHAQDLTSKLDSISLNQSISKESVKGAEEMISMLSSQVKSVADLTAKQAVSSRGHHTLDVHSQVAYASASSALSNQRASNVGGPQDAVSRTYDSEFRKQSRAKASATTSLGFQF